MKRITKKQTEALLQKVQSIQLIDRGLHMINISTHNSKGKLWFCASSFMGENAMMHCECYEWRDYATNLESINHFVRAIEEDLKSLSGKKQN